MEEKKRIRLESAARQGALEEAYLRASDEEICARVLALEEYRAAPVLFCYVSAGREPDTRRLISRALESGKRVGVPLCIGDGIMEVREIGCWEDLEEGKYGIPAPKAECPVLPLPEIALAVIPCVTCSHACLRLGHGGGYYDRCLEKLRSPAVCLCRERMVREDIPLESHDRPVDILVTETGVFRRHEFSAQIR